MNVRAVDRHHPWRADSCVERLLKRRRLKVFGGEGAMYREWVPDERKEAGKARADGNCQNPLPIEDESEGKTCFSSAGWLQPLQPTFCGRDCLK